MGFGYYVKSLENFQFRSIKSERDAPTRQIKRKWDNEKGKIVNVKDEDGKVIYQEVDEYTY